MQKEAKIQHFGKNVALSVFAQIISLLVNLILNLIVPRFVSEYEYAYWQMYVLYISYVGVLHFGLLDGMVLRYAKYDYEELDKPCIRSQFLSLLIIISMGSLGIMSIALLGLENEYKIIWMLVAVGIVTKNIFTYTSYLLQCTNRISKYAPIVIAQRGIYGILAIVLLISGMKNFFWFCAVDLVGDIVGVCFGAKYNKGLYFGKLIPLKKALEELWVNMGTGIKLLIANWSAALLVGSARMIIQWHWGDLSFGKVSFAFSVTQLFLGFITAISVVLFPTLKRMKPEEMPNLYQTIRGMISPVLYFMMTFYFPGRIILQYWLPTYSVSLDYLGILLPIIIYSSKVSLLTNNYLKAYRKEKAMLWINVFSVSIAFMCFTICAYIIDNMNLLLYCIVIAIMLRSIVSEVIVMRVIRIRVVKDFIIEAVMTIFFIVCARMDSHTLGSVSYLLALVGYLIYDRKFLSKILEKIYKRERKR